MKRALHFATKLNSRDIQKCNCFWVPSYDLFASARKGVFPAPTATEKQQSFLNQSLPPPPPPPIKIPGSAPVTDITSLTFIDNKSHDVPSCKRSLLLSFWVRRTKGGSPYKHLVQNCIQQQAVHAQQRYYRIHAESFPSTPNKWLRSAFPKHWISYSICLPVLFAYSLLGLY